MPEPYPAPSQTMPIEASNIDVSSSDATFDPPINGFIPSGNGSVKVTMAGTRSGWSVSTIPACVAGQLYIGRIIRIWNVGTNNDGKADIWVCRN